MTAGGIASSALQHARNAHGATIAPTTDPTIHFQPPFGAAVASARFSRARGSADTTTAREQPGHESARPQQQLSDAAIIQRGDRPTRRPSGRAAAAAPPELGTCRRPRGAGRRGNKRCKCFSKPHRRRPRQGEGRRRRRVHALGSPQLHQLGVLVALRVVQLSPAPHFPRNPTSRSCCSRLVLTTESRISKALRRLHGPPSAGTQR